PINHRLARPGSNPVAALEKAARARQHLEALLHRRMDVGSDPTARIDPGLYVEDLGAVLVGRAAKAQALAKDWIFDRLHNLVQTSLLNLRRSLLAQPRDRLRDALAHADLRLPAEQLACLLHRRPTPLHIHLEA